MACACGSNNDPGSKFAPDGSTPKANISGAVANIFGDTGTAVANMTVKVLGAETLSATTNTNGEFTLTNVPSGWVYLVAEHADYWGAVVAVDLGTAGATGIEMGVISLVQGDDYFDGTKALDRNKGIVVFDFDGESTEGGETADLDRSYDGPYLPSDMAPVAADSLPGGGNGSTLLFVNVPTGSVKVTIDGAAGVTECGIATGAEWPVVAGALTFIPVTCTPL